MRAYREKEYIIVYTEFFISRSWGRRAVPQTKMRWTHTKLYFRIPVCSFVVQSVYKLFFVVITCLLWIVMVARSGLKFGTTKRERASVSKIVLLPMISEDDLVISRWELVRWRMSYSVRMPIWYFSFLVCTASGKSLVNCAAMCLAFFDDENRKIRHNTEYVSVEGFKMPLVVMANGGEYEWNHGD